MENQKPKQRYTLKVLNFRDADDFYMHLGQRDANSKHFWRFGDDNCFPDAVATLNRRSPIHRGILNSKIGYLVGKKFLHNDRNSNLEAFVKDCNGRRQSLKDVMRRVWFDKKAFGNAYIEIVRDRSGKFINLFHQDALKCRLSKDKSEILLYHDWPAYTDQFKDKLKRLPVYPVFADPQNTGFERSIYHIKEYEPGFENYGLMDWFSGMRVGAIAYKTSKWNISRLDNSFHSSGVLLIDGNFDNPENAEKFQDDVEEEFTGEDNQGKILSITSTRTDGKENGSKFIPLSLDYDGDWKELQSQSTTELIIAHGWFRALTSLPDNTGFDVKRILNEYNIAMSTVIADEQETMLDILKEILNSQAGLDVSDLAILNKPPTTDRPPYMKIWEARESDGLDFDKDDPEQQAYIGTITAAKAKTDA
jgi:hypothetical protein